MIVISALLCAKRQLLCNNYLYHPHTEKNSVILTCLRVLYQCPKKQPIAHVLFGEVC